MITPKILLIDDLDFFLDLEKAYLKFTPAMIFTAGDREEAFQKAKEHLPKAIFLDMHLSGTYGIECLSRLKKDSETKQIPVVSVIKASGGIDRNACLHLGAEEVLFKPFTKGEFLEKAHRFLFDLNRREPRVDCEFPASLITGAGEIPCVAIDLSTGGIYLKIRDIVIRPGTRTKVRLQIPGCKIIEVDAVVSWLNQGRNRPRLMRPQGLGLRFLSVSHEARAVLEYVVRSVIPGRSPIEIAHRSESKIAEQQRVGPSRL